MNLIPLPKKITLLDGVFDFSRRDPIIEFESQAAAVSLRPAAEKLRRTLSGLLGSEIAVVTGRGDQPGNIVLAVNSAASRSQSYKLKVGTEGIEISGSGPAGVFYGVMTLLQLITMEGVQLPCCTIVDKPDFARRGFMHDVTRGKVPTLATLKSLADKLAYYKYNELQLYVEHTFAFKTMPELWQGHDPLTADDIAELDLYCRKNHVELVPALASFGHLYELLRLERFEHLNELPIRASQLPHSLWDRMAHYTIDAGTEESFLLVKSMLDEYLPLFGSDKCNICCDETFDLGHGKNAMLNATLGPGRLYVGFVKKLIGVVLSHGKKAMLWGDIVLKYPDMIREIPRGTQFLNWDYTAGVTDKAARTFAAAQVPQYVCPGVCGWSRFAADIDTASANIRRQIRYGRENNALGVLLTDWGDCGHPNMLAHSFHGLILSSALAWNGDSYATDGHFDAAVSTLEWGELTGRLGMLLRELGSLCFYHFGNIYAWVNNEQCLWNREADVRGLAFDELEKKYRHAHDIHEMISVFKKTGGFQQVEQDFDEFLLGAFAVKWTLGLLAFKKREEYGQKECPALYGDKQNLIEEGRALIERFSVLWLKRNRKSELNNITDTFEKVFNKIAVMGEEQI